MPRKISSVISHQLSAIRKELRLCVLSAVLLILSFPNFNLWICAWFGFVPAFFALKNKSLKQAFVLFFITGIIFWWGIIYWLVNVTFSGTFVLVLYLSLYFGVFALVIRPFTRKSSLFILLFVPSVWVLLEYARAHLLTGFPWAILGYSQYLNLPSIQIADITGAWGVSFLLMFVNTAIVEIIWAFREKLMSRLKIAVILLIALLSLTLFYGFFILSRESRFENRESIKVAVIQGNIPQEMKWEPSAKEYILKKYIAISEKAAKDGPDIIIWPEAALPFILEEEPLFFEQVNDAVRKMNRRLLLGAVTVQGDVYYNSAIFISPTGRVLAKYNKLHLVPFGEFIPLRKIFPFLETVAPIGDIARGREYTIFGINSHKFSTEYQVPSTGQKESRVEKNKDIKFAVLICFEDLFPELSREFVGHGAQFLVNITNDAWYKKTSAPFQHLQASVLRAVENRVYMARAANTGISGFISPGGKIISLVKAPDGENTFVDGYAIREIHISKNKPSFYTRYGDVFIVICVLFMVYGAIQLAISYQASAISKKQQR